jgi:hypothetical protein
MEQQSGVKEAQMERMIGWRVLKETCRSNWFWGIKPMLFTV